MMEKKKKEHKPEELIPKLGSGYANKAAKEIEGRKKKMQQMMEEMDADLYGKKKEKK